MQSQNFSSNRHTAMSVQQQIVIVMCMQKSNRYVYAFNAFFLNTFFNNNIIIIIIAKNFQTLVGGVCVVHGCMCTCVNLQVQCVLFTVCTVCAYVCTVCAYACVHM